MTPPTLLLLAGPNGAGKSTFARHGLRSFVDAGTFLNADDMARDSRPDDVSAAAMEVARGMLLERRALLAGHVSFCVETTLASRTLLNLVGAAKATGYRCSLIFLFTPDSRLNESRVKQRVMLGGHNIDTDTIRRRHARGLRLLPDFWDACDEAIVFDALDRQPTEIARKDDDGIRIVRDRAWARLRRHVVAVGGRPLRDA